LDHADDAATRPMVLREVARSSGGAGRRWPRKGEGW
jgi:hypothetical protein